MAANEQISFVLVNRFLFTLKCKGKKRKNGQTSTRSVASRDTGLALGFTRKRDRSTFWCLKIKSSRRITENLSRQFRIVLKDTVLEKQCKDMDGM